MSRRVYASVLLARKGEKWLQEKEWKQGIHMPRASWLDKDIVRGGR